MKQPFSEPEFIIRLFDPERDIPGLVALKAEIEAIDRVGTNTSEAAVRAQMKWLGHDPAKDRWVAFSPDAPDKFIGHAWTFAQSPQRSVVSVGVHPAWRRKGLGSSLLAKTLVRAKEHGAVEIVSGTEASNLAGDAFLKQHGFSAAGHARFMSAPEGASLREVQWPAGYTVRNFAEVRDLSFLVDACNRCYKEMWGHRENTEPSTEDFYAGLMKQYPELFPAEGIFILFAPDQAVAGVCFGRIEDQQKTVDSPAVVPAHRRHNLLRPLTLTAMRWLDAQAGGGFRLQTWGDSEAAVQVYEEIGFTLDENDHTVEYLWSGNTTNAR